MTLITADKAMAHIDRLALWKAGAKPAPVTVEWDLSNRCSLGCQYCHFAHTHTKGPWAGRTRALPVAFDDTGGTGDLADPEMVARGLSQMAKAGVRGVVWSGGGEPTLHPQWQMMMWTAKSCGLKQGMYTLGGHLTPDSAAVLADLATWVVVSLDCDDAESYAGEKGVKGDRFNAACNGIRWLAEAGRATGGTVGVSFLLHAGNWRRVGSMVDLARSLGATYSMIRPTIETSPDNPAVCLSDRGWIDKALPSLEKLSGESDVECDPARFTDYRDWTTGGGGGRGYHTCHAIKLNATITPDGRVWVCPQRRGVEGSCVGDLRTESFDSLWSRHVGQWTDFSQCRAMCRLHLLNKAVAPVFEDYPHAEFL